MSQPRSGVNVRWWNRGIVLLLAAHLLLTLAFVTWNPLGEAPDEVDHWAYVVYLAREREMPVGPRVTQSKHPPLYHASAAAFASLLAEPRFDFLRSNPDARIWPVEDWPAEERSPNFFIHTTLESWPWRGGALAFHLARIWSALLSTGAVAATYGLLRSALPERKDVALFGAGILAFLPEFAFIGAAVSNDVAAALFATLGLWGGMAIYRGETRARSHVWLALGTGLCLGLGLLAKVSTISVWPVVALAVAMGPMRQSVRQPARLWQGVWRSAPTQVALFVPALALASPWLIRNWRLYGDPLGMELVRATVDQRLEPWTWGDTMWLLRGWFVSFWGKFGGAGHLAYPNVVYVALGVFSLVAAAGLLRVWFTPACKSERGAIFLLAAACAATAAGIANYSLVALGTDQGRLLYPAVGPIVGLMAVGIAVWIPSRMRWSMYGAVWAALLLLGVYGLAGVIRPAFAPPSPPAESGVQAAIQETPIRFGDLTLLGWRLEGDPVLYWRSEAALDVDLRVALRVVAADGSLVWEKKRSPGYGRYSTDHWAAGTTMRDVYRVEWPEWAGTGEYRVEVVVQPFDGEAMAAQRGDAVESPPIYLGQLAR